MNRLHVINFYYKNGYLLSTFYAWDADTIKEKIKSMPEWNYSITENNDIHCIWDAH